ncbi:MAG: M20/M25/M40 family metallo-hydrolase [Armatimonadetes bacterium]|nr:M20/M25/M40 family metallo-hydrolase [Armatimonadota bacterium]
MEDIYAHIDAHRDAILADFFTLLREPSVSAKKQGLDQCCDVLQGMMAHDGIASRKMDVPGGPPLLFSHLTSKALDKTLLCYAHYDVQPPEPLELWQTPPFQPTIRHGVIYARGATDNKAGILAFWKAAQAFLAVRGDLPCHLKFVIEGEEEVGSPHFLPWVAANKGLLECDASTCLDGPADHSTKMPAIKLGIKAILYVELRLKTNEKDVWSGYAGFVPSPTWRMIKLLTTILDTDTGMVKVDGWYDDLAPITPDDEELLRQELARFDEKEAQRELGIRQWAWGLDAWEALKRRHYGGTGNIAGFTAGYGGEGVKTIIPSEVRVKMDFRCAPFLEPARQIEKLRTHLRKHGFDDVELIVHTARANPYKTSPREPISQAVIRAAEKVFGGLPTVYGVSTNGLIKVHVPHPAVLSGYADPDCRLHAPNENIPVDRFFKGIKYAATIMQEYAKGVSG